MDLLDEKTIIVQGKAVEAPFSLPYFQRFIDEHCGEMIRSLKGKALFAPHTPLSKLKDRLKKSKKEWHRVPHHFRSLAHHIRVDDEDALLILKGSDLYNPHLLALRKGQVDYIIENEEIVGGCGLLDCLVEHSATALIQETALRLYKRPTYVPIPIDVVEITEICDLQMKITPQTFFGKYYAFRDHPLTRDILNKYLEYEYGWRSRVLKKLVKFSYWKGKYLNEIWVGPSEYRYAIKGTDYRLFDFALILKDVMDRKKSTDIKMDEGSYSEIYLEGLDSKEIIDFFYGLMCRHFDISFEPPATSAPLGEKCQDKLGYLEKILKRSFERKDWHTLVSSFAARVGEVGGLAHGIGLAGFRNPFVPYTQGSFASQNINLSGEVLDWSDVAWIGTADNLDEWQAHDIVAAFDSFMTLGHILWGVLKHCEYTRETWKRTSEQERQLRKAAWDSFIRAYKDNFFLAGFLNGEKEEDIKEKLQTILRNDILITHADRFFNINSDTIVLEHTCRTVLTEEPINLKKAIQWYQDEIMPLYYTR